MIRVSILGSGNVATHLINAFLKADAVELVQVYSRTIGAIEHLKNDVQITDTTQNLIPVDVTIIAISDDTIAEFSNQLNIKGVVAHTSGSVSITDLNDSLSKGVFYPLQTFSKDKGVDFSEIPICLEAENNETLNILKKIASAISDKVYEVNSIQREKLHLAAVFVNNFTNHLYQIGNSICDEHKIPFEILHPLIKETACKIKEISPKDAQTGPAKRKDFKTIDKHLNQLSEQEKKIYTILTNSISKTYQ
ncbi:MAG: DUF2520 domain-containing protein [Urechidicola sp.]|nr:DUF2520 domain-containing protein [Urechidicola sp.]